MGGNSRAQRGAGGATLDFKGNLLASERQLATTYDATVDWSALATDTTVTALESHAASSLETEVFTETRAYDALNRPTSLITPDSSEVLPTYNEAGLLESVAVKVRGATTASNVVTAIDYDAQGRRTEIAYANGTSTAYEYDELTFRLTRTLSTRESPAATLQDLGYTYDPVGNILETADEAQQTLFFGNLVTTAGAQYEYEASYRLAWASGREHAGTGGDVQRDNNDLPLRTLPHANDANAVRPYQQDFAYDAIGNLLSYQHTRVGNSSASWTRTYSYVSGTNRLASNSISGGTASYSYDAHGNTTAMPHLSTIAYSPFDQMAEADLGGGGTAYFVYDASGQRVRKVHEHSSSTLVEERIYLGGYELYRKHDSSGTLLERQTLHVMDGTRRVAMVETKTIEDDIAITDPAELWRFQLDNHLGSACLELDDAGAVISYEEYHPFGTSAYRAANASEVSERRYRYIGRERDEETGFYSMGVRYYAPWLGRWTTADPAGIGADGPGLYTYCRGNPVTLSDPNGRDPEAVAVAEEVAWGVTPIVPIAAQTAARVVAQYSRMVNMAGGVQGARVLQGAGAVGATEAAVVGAGVSAGETVGAGAAVGAEGGSRFGLTGMLIGAAVVAFAAGGLYQAYLQSREHASDKPKAVAASSANPVKQEAPPPIPPEPVEAPAKEKSAVSAPGFWGGALKAVFPAAGIIADMVFPGTAGSEETRVASSGAPRRDAPVAKTATLGLGDALLEFSEGRGVPWLLWTDVLTRRSTHGTAFGRALTDVLRNAEAIKFDLTGIRDLKEAFERGKKGFRYEVRGEEVIPRNATNTEFATVLRSPDFLKKTTFYRDGKAVETADVLKEAGVQ
ncbi:MAG: RHS repeat-associated core domain-containing protein [Polyangiaceae bacterium]